MSFPPVTSLLFQTLISSLHFSSLRNCYQYPSLVFSCLLFSSLLVQLALISYILLTSKLFSLPFSSPLFFSKLFYLHFSSLPFFSLSNCYFFSYLFSLLFFSLSNFYFFSSLLFTKESAIESDPRSSLMEGQSSAKWSLESAALAITEETCG